MAAVPTNKLVFRAGSTPTDYSAAVSKCVVMADESEADFTSFADAAAGGARQYTLDLTMTQDTASTSLWYLIWNSAGSEVPVEVWPYGRPVSGTATTAQPKVTGTVTVREPDGELLGGEADKSVTARMLTEVSWPFTAKPTLATA